MPNRVLHAGLLTSKRWNRCSWIAQSAYVRLLTLVDDFGRYEADPVILKSHLFPLHVEPAVTVELVLDIINEWVKEDLLEIYLKEEDIFLQLKRWKNTPRAKNSRYPNPPSANICKQMQADARTCKQMHRLTGTVTGTVTGTETACTDAANVHSNPTHKGGGVEGDESPPPPPPGEPAKAGVGVSSDLPPGKQPGSKKKPWQPDDLQVRLGNLYGKTKEWSDKEKASYRKADIDAEEVDLIEQFYTYRRTLPEPYTRKELLTLLNNWPGEVDRARIWKAERASQPLQPRRYGPNI